MGMLTDRQLEELAPLYEEFMEAENPRAPSVLQAKLVFDSECRKMHAEQIERGGEVPFHAFQAGIIVLELQKYLKARKYPTVLPERRG